MDLPGKAVEERPSLIIENMKRKRQISVNKCYKEKSQKLIGSEGRHVSSIKNLERNISNKKKYLNENSTDVIARGEDSSLVSHHKNEQKLKRNNLKAKRSKNHSSTKSELKVFLCTKCTYILNKCTCNCDNSNNSDSKKRKSNSKKPIEYRNKINGLKLIQNNYKSELLANSSLSQKINMRESDEKNSLLNISSRNTKKKPKTSINQSKYLNESNVTPKYTNETLKSQDKKTRDDSDINISDSKMEVDEWDGLPSSEKDANFEKIIIVDTNILMSDREVLEQLREGKFYGEDMKIIIPYIVLQELDCLKSKGKNSDALSAIKWLNSYLEKEDPYIQGEDFNHYKKAAEEFGEAKGDDAIHSSCMLFKRNFPNVYLLSNDINLRNKALVSKIYSISAQQLQKFMSEYMNKSLNNESLNSSNIVPINVVNTSIDENNELRKYQSDSKIKFEIKNSIINQLGSLLEYAMKESFGDLWKKIVKHKPPWSSDEVLECIEKHWIAVFIDKLFYDIKDQIQTLKLFMKQGNFKEAESQFSKIIESIDNEPYKTIVRQISNKTEPKVSNELTNNEVNNKFALSASSSFEYFQASIQEIGQFSTAVIKESEDEVLQMKEEVPDHSENVLLNQIREKTENFQCLRNILVSFGFLLVSLKSGGDDATVESLKRKVKELSELSRRSFSFQNLRDEDVKLISDSPQGKELLECSISGFEKVIQSIDCLIERYKYTCKS